MDMNPGGEYASIVAPLTIPSSYVLELPVDDGLLNQLLKTDGAGVLSWINGVTGGRRNTPATHSVRLRQSSITTSIPNSASRISWIYIRL